MKSKPSSPEERPLRFVLNDQQSFWGQARSGDQAGTQVTGHWNVTNVSDRDIVILGARLANHAAHMTVVLTEGPADRFGRRTFNSRNSIRANRMSQVTANLFFFPAICDGYDPLIADVVFTDNYESEHIVRQARFRPIKPAPSTKKKSTISLWTSRRAFSICKSANPAHFSKREEAACTT